MQIRRFWREWLFCLVLIVCPAVIHANPVESSLQIQTQVNEAASQSQVKVDQLSETTARLLAEYRQDSRQTESLRVYNDQLERLIESQEEEMTSLHKQLRDVEVAHREIIPLVLRMVDSLDQFIELDVPFLLEERRARVAGLHELMDRADVAIAEKYRRVMEAYLVETEYGRTIEAYRGLFDDAGQRRTVHFLRLGRVSLMYLTLDGKEAGYWNQKSKRWAVLPDDYRSSIARGLRIARKQAAPDLLKLPVAAPEVVK